MATFWESVRPVPSVTVTVTLYDPVWFAAGIQEKLPAGVIEAPDVVVVTPVSEKATVSAVPSL